jgi:hypothetical protein
MPAELEKMVAAIKKQLRDKYPKKDDKEIDQMAWAIANSKFKKESVSEEIVVGENVKINIMCEAIIGEEIKE